MNRNRFIQGLKSNIQFSEKERQRIIRRSLQKYPWKTKCTVAMEEFAELQQQISKQVRGYGDRIGLLEEMADALTEAFGFGPSVSENKRKKSLSSPARYGMSLRKSRRDSFVKQYSYRPIARKHLPYQRRNY